MSFLRWTNVKREWRPTKSLQALMCSVLPSYWDIASDVRWVSTVKTEFFPDLAGRHLLDCHLSEPILSKQQTRLHLGKVTKWEKLSIIFQLDSDAGVPAWSPAVQLREQVGEGEVDLEVEICLPLLSNHPGMLQGRLTKDKSLLIVFYHRLPFC